METIKCPKCGRDFLSCDNNPKGTTAINYVKCMKCKTIFPKSQVIEFSRKWERDIVFCKKHNKDKIKDIWGNYRCDECKKEEKKIIKQQKHQARLDKVLSKFTEFVNPTITEDMYFTILETDDNEGYFTELDIIHHINNTFSLSLYEGKIQISLDTVESLLKDLGVDSVVTR